ncbi:MAG: hypothetical protein ACLP01_01990 [Solirubrobacteraceae bacterium]
MRAARDLGFTITSEDPGFTITSEDPACATLSFGTSVPSTTWRGPVMTVAITAENDGARIVVGGRRHDGYGLELARWHQAKSSR